MALSKDGRILGLCCVHADDFLVALDESKSEHQQHSEALKQQFQRGSRKMLTAPTVACIFVKILCMTGGAKFAWISMICSSGSPQWLATQTMPRIQAELSILQGEQHTVGTLRKLNMLLRQAQQSCSRPLVFHFHRAPCVVTYSDAAWAVRRKGECHVPG